MISQPSNLVAREGLTRGGGNLLHHTRELLHHVPILLHFVVSRWGVVRMVVGSPNDLTPYISYVVSVVTTYIKSIGYSTLRTVEGLSATKNDTFCSTRILCNPSYYLLRYYTPLPRRSCYEL